MVKAFATASKTGGSGDEGDRLIEARARRNPDGVGSPSGILECSTEERSSAVASGDVKGR